MLAEFVIRDDELPPKEAMPMKASRTTRTETRSGAPMASCDKRAAQLDQQFCEFIEVVWSCERRWALEDRIDAASRYGRQVRPQGEMR